MPAKSRFFAANIVLSDRYLGGDFVLSKANALSRALAPDGSQPKAGSAFAAAVHVGSDDERVKRAFEASEPARAAAMEALSLGIPNCSCSKGKLRALRPRRGFSGSSWKAKSERLGAALDELADAMLAAEPSLREWRPEPSRSGRMLLFWTLGLSALAAFASAAADASWRSSHPYADLWAASGIPWGAVLAAPLFGAAFGLGAVWLFARSSARLPQLMAAGLACGLQLAAVGGPALVQYANANLPSMGPRASYDARASYSLGRGKNNSVVLRLELTAPTPEALAAAGIAPGEIYAQRFIARGSRGLAPASGLVHVSIERGALGYPIVRSVDPGNGYADPLAGSVR